MCNPACLDFGRRRLAREHLADRTVLEVGAYDVNGSLRPYVESCGPRSYLGVDITPGPGVDELCDVCELSARFAAESFDVVLCTEVLEHVRNWRRAVRELTTVLRRGGILLMTTRSAGFPLHSYPADYWRYELDDIPRIFPGMRIEQLESDPYAPGVFLLARKEFVPAIDGIDDYELYSIVRSRRCREITNLDIIRFSIRRRLLRTLPRSIRPAC
jgi:SAM-dependent methyltransferase